MARKKTTTALWCISSIIFLLIFQAIPAEAISRGIMAEAIIESLAIPRWTEKNISQMCQKPPCIWPGNSTALSSRTIPSRSRSDSHGSIAFRLQSHGLVSRGKTH